MIRGAISCWEPSVPPWPCSDRVPGRSMLAFLDGSASTFEIERIKSPTTFGLVPTPVKGHSFCSDMVSTVTPSGVVPRRDRLHNARHEQRGLTSVQRSSIGEASYG